MINMVSAGYLQGLGGVLAQASSPTLAALIPAATSRIESYCGCRFYARRHSAERYDAISRHSLSLKHSPLVQLNLVTLFPDGPIPQTFTAAAFDVDYAQARLTFVYNQNGTFFQRLASAGPMTTRLADIVAVDYFAGYGWATTLAQPVAAGTSQQIELTAYNGRVPGQEPWNAADAAQVTLDPGTAIEETVSVSWNGPEMIAASVQFAHASGAYASGNNVPQDAQFAAALLVTNMINAGDLTKQEEMVGRLGGYTYQQRKANDVILTPEITALLARYKEVIV